MNVGGSSIATVVYGTTWRWFMQGTLFCIQQTPEQAVNIFCNANAQTEMNTLMGKLRNHDIIDFHNVLFTTSMTINICSKLPSACTGASGYIVQDDLTFENANFAYSSTQTVLIECTPCQAFIIPVITGVHFSNWHFNQTGSVSSSGPSGVTVYVQSMTGAIFDKWVVCCGFFSLLEDQSSVSQSKYYGWDMEGTAVSGTKFALALSDFGVVASSVLNNVDGGITNAGSNLVITDDTIVGLFYCIEVVQIAAVVGTAMSCPTDVHVLNGGSATVDDNAFLIGSTPFLVDAGGFVTASNNLNYNPVGTFAVTVTASPFTFTDTAFVLETLYIRGGAITSITKSGVTLFGALAAGSAVTVSMYPGQSIIITYTVMPSITVDEF